MAWPSEKRVRDVPLPQTNSLKSNFIIARSMKIPKKVIIKAYFWTYVIGIIVPGLISLFIVWNIPSIGNYFLNILMKGILFLICWIALIVAFFLIGWIWAKKTEFNDD